MSNSVYPSLPGLMFPVGRQVIPPPVQVRTTPSQREYRARDATLPRYQYSLAYEFLRTGNRGAELATLLGFYNSVGGPFDSFLFQDPDDNSVTANAFGIGDGTTTSWQLLRTFGGFAEPVYDPATVPAVLVNGVNANLMPGGSFEVDSNADGLADGWSVFSSGSVSGVTPSIVTGGAPQDGSKEQGVNATFGATGSTNVVLIYRTISFSQQPGDITAAVQVRSGGSVNAQVVLNCKDANGNTISFINLVDQAVTSSVRIGGTATPPQGTRQVALELRAYCTATGARSVYWDAAQLKVGTTSLTYPGSSSYSVGATGLVTFDSAPANGSSLAWTGSFYRRCRFVGDSMDTSKFMQDLFEAKAVKFISTKA